jgi:hypothetical protein
MKKKLNQFWTWYDNLKEPWRMLFAVFVICSPMHIGAFTGNYFIFGLIIPIMISKIICLDLK